MTEEDREILIEVLNERFGKISNRMPKQLENIDSRDRLKDLLRQALKVKSLNEFEEKMLVN